MNENYGQNFRKNKKKNFVSQSIIETFFWNKLQIRSMPRYRTSNRLVIKAIGGPKTLWIPQKTNHLAQKFRGAIRTKLLTGRKGQLCFLHHSGLKAADYFTKSAWWINGLSTPTCQKNGKSTKSKKNLKDWSIQSGWNGKYYKYNKCITSPQVNRRTGCHGFIKL